jgi:hypothetical protein
MILDDRVYELLSAIDRIIEERNDTHRIEREVQTLLGENGESQRIDIFAIDKKRAKEPDIIPELDQVAKKARDEAARIGFDTTPVRSAKDRPACRYFEIQ